MSELSQEVSWQESYRRVSRILPALTKKELDLIGDIADEFRKSSALEVGIKPLSEKEMLAMVDHSIEQADRGKVCSLEETLAFIDKEFAL